MAATVSSNFLYHYVAKVTKVYDGDTITVAIDVGLHTWIHDEKIRLARINTPEIRGNEREAGLKARDFLADLILGKTIVIKTIKDKKGKYGRYLGEIWLEQEYGFINLNDLLVQEGYAEYVSYD